MNKQRYFLEKHDFSKPPQIAKVSNNYHFQELEKGFIFGIASLAAEHMNSAWDHPDIFLFPSIHDRRPISYWIAEQKIDHPIQATLEHYGILGTECGRDALIKLTDHLDHALFELDQ